jgi:hypothetical protein
MQMTPNRAKTHKEKKDKVLMIFAKAERKQMAELQR